MSALRKAISAAASAPEILPGGNLRRKFRFAPDSPVFLGHFPLRPVLPAMVQILMGQATLEDCGHEGVLAGIPEAKFLAPLAPEEDLELLVSPGGGPGVWACVVQNRAGVAARFRVETCAG